jgi:hypothetical protein
MDSTAYCRQIYTYVSHHIPILTSRTFIIVSAGNEDVVIELVGAGANVKKTNDKGLTPL